MPIGCLAIDSAAPVCTFDVGPSPAEFACPGRTRPAGPVRRAVEGQGDVVDDAHSVAEPVSTAPLDRLPDRRQPERLTGVDGEMRVLPAQVFEGVQMTGGRKARLGTGDVEPGDLLVPVSRRPARRSPATGRRAASRSAAHGPGSDARPRPPPLPAAKPSSTACTTSASSSPARRAVPARTAPRRRRPRRPPDPARTRDATRISASRVCMTPTVCVNVSR